MPLIEEVNEDDAGGPGPSTTADLLTRIRQLTEQLYLSDDLLPSFMGQNRSLKATENYRTQALIVVDLLRPLLASTTFEQLSTAEQSEAIFPLLRIRGDEPCGSDTLIRRIDQAIEGADLPSTATLGDIALHTLRNPLRQLFTAPHPMLSTSTHRALARPAGGEAARGDLHDDAAQQWKKAPAQGCQNILAWCAAQLSDADIEKHIGTVLPPTLTMMDDWDPAWRIRGVLVLDTWISKIPPENMRRMGLDQLLLDSIIHTLSLLSPNPNTDRVLRTALDLIEKTCDRRKKSDRLGEIVQKAIVDGWQYAPSGSEGRVVLIQIARQVEVLCDETALGESIVRWLKDVVPNLLQPLQFSPSKAALPHFRANLSALLTVMRAVQATGRIVRWRGQILQVLGRLAIQLAEERDLEDISGSATERSAEDCTDDLSDIVRDVFILLAEQCPAVVQDEYPRLLALDRRVFSPLIPSVA